MARDLEEAEEELERVKVRFRRKKIIKKRENSFMRDFVSYFYFSLFFSECTIFEVLTIIMRIIIYSISLWSVLWWWWYYNLYWNDDDVYIVMILSAWILQFFEYQLSSWKLWILIIIMINIFLTFRVFMRNRY